jgi:transcriptional regulator with XRE-family HTH domain
MRRETGFADRLRELRGKAGLTLAELADRAEMHLQGLAKLEAGTREPQWGTVIALADALGVKVTAFLSGEAKPARKRRKK